VVLVTYFDIIEDDEWAGRWLMRDIWATKKEIAYPLIAETVL
jgi:hypothetical protein